MDHLGTTIDATEQSVTRTADGTTREFSITEFINDSSTTVSHTISTNKSVRVTIDGITQDDRLLTRKGTCDISTVKTDASIFYGSTDGRIFDIEYHVGVEAGGDATAFRARARANRAAASLTGHAASAAWQCGTRRSAVGVARACCAGEGRVDAT